MLAILNQVVTLLVPQLGIHDLAHGCFRQEHK
jgi:hypothetical protein